MDYKSTLTTLFYILIGADGHVNERELSLGKKMMQAEGLNESTFNAQMENLKGKSVSTLYSECLVGLKKLETPLQIRSIAWLCVIANSDGFMDKQEWILIYKIYHTELGLPLEEVMKTQKELNKVIHGKSFQSLGVLVSS
jgi:uncharacterized tellurite resistance protein B-like protein